MRVYEVAREFQIESEKLLTLLRGMGVQVRSEASAVEDTVVAKLRARFERERRAGHGATAQPKFRVTLPLSSEWLPGSG